jgi:hypothetical protein
VRKKYGRNKVFEDILIEFFNIDMGPATHMKTDPYVSGSGSATLFTTVETGYLIFTSALLVLISKQFLL